MRKSIAPPGRCTFCIPWPALLCVSEESQTGARTSGTDIHTAAYIESPNGRLVNCDGNITIIGLAGNTVKATVGETRDGTAIGRDVVLVDELPPVPDEVLFREPHPY